ncbi:MAG: hypothetical protein E7622_01660 [Ruminococcaceae bacterium]|nr:hypothetical protein [Oscillospiraceae bacterium]
MSKKIIERRNASVNVPEASRASIVNAPQNRKRSPIKGIILTVLIVFALLALALTAINFLINNIFGKVAPNGSYKDTLPSIVHSYKEGNPFYNGKAAEYSGYYKFAYDASSNHSATVNNIKDQDNVLNYAIFGIENEDPNNPYADMIIIASVNKDTGNLTYVLIDASSFVQIPYADVVGPLKDAYKLGGSNLLARTIAQNFGVDIDGFVELKMSGAADMVDAVGGIEIAMTDEEVANLNLAIQAYNERFNAEVLEITKKGAAVNLNGVQTLAYIRGVGDNREIAVFNILAQVTKIALSQGVSGINNLVTELTENAVASTNGDDFSTLLQIAIKSKDGSNGVVTINLGSDLKQETWYHGVRFVTYTDYSEVVSQLQAALYTPVE